MHFASIGHALRFYKTEVRFCILMMAKSGYGLPALVCPTSRDYYYYYFRRYQHYSLILGLCNAVEFSPWTVDTDAQTKLFLQLRAQTCAILHQLKPRNLKSSRIANFVPRQVFGKYKNDSATKRIALGERAMDREQRSVSKVRFALLRPQFFPCS